ncbi:hypothetical protein J7K43_06740 [Candidatus Calescamantes bacterium]|nr:hypothetical protein [Candidatus Calescamantes bacterium]
MGFKGKMSFVSLSYKRHTKKYCFLWQDDEKIVVEIPRDEKRGITTQCYIRIIVDGISFGFKGFTIAGVKVKKASYRTEGERLIIEHTVQDSSQNLLVVIWMQPNSKKICFKIFHPLIKEVGINRLSTGIRRVYTSFGVVMEKPVGCIAQGYEELTTKFIIMELDNGMFVLQSADPLPSRLEMDVNKCSLFSSLQETTFQLAFSNMGIKEVVKQYKREINFPPSPYLSRLKGRPVYDIWEWRSFDYVRKILSQLFTYEATNAVVLIHIWQKYGYDRKLPDVFPANPNQGGNKALLEVKKLCEKYNCLFGLHDNYSDTYPDAASYDPRNVARDKEGNLIPMWFNVIQSYMILPHKIFEFAKRNFEKIKKVFQPSAYFIDVLGSISCREYYDEKGKRYTPVDMLRNYQKLLNYAREYFRCPVFTEDGCEWVVENIDGATCNFRDPERVWKIKCKDWEYYPVIDFVYHDRIVYHGVGYSQRFRFGVRTDNYMSCEILTGHPALIEIRTQQCEFDLAHCLKKYYMLHDFSKLVGLHPMVDVQFSGDNIHRLIVKYANGTIVYVNRGKDIWLVEGKNLPQYGFLVQGKEFIEYSALRKKTRGKYGYKDRVDYVRSTGLLYVDARGKVYDFGEIVTDGSVLVKWGDKNLKIFPIEKVKVLNINLSDFVSDLKVNASKIKICSYNLQRKEIKSVNYRIKDNKIQILLEKEPRVLYYYLELGKNEE